MSTPKGRKSSGAKPQLASRTLRASIDGYVENVITKEHQNILDGIVEFLSDKPEQAKRCLIALRGGCFESGGNSEKEVIPETSTKLRLVSQKAMATALLHMTSAFDKATLALWRKSDSKLQHKLFYVAVSASPEQPVCTHDLLEFIRIYKARAVACNDRLATMVKKDNGPDWPNWGCYTMVNSTERPELVARIKHISGTEVIVPDDMVIQRSQAVLECNWDAESTQLKYGMGQCINLMELFRSLGQPIAPWAPAAPVASEGSSASSGQSVLPPPARSPDAETPTRIEPETPPAKIRKTLEDGELPLAPFDEPGA